MTNYEKIKQMSIDEMAEQIDFMYEKQCKCEYCIGCGNELYDCSHNIKLWLESEAEE